MQRTRQKYANEVAVREAKFNLDALFCEDNAPQVIVKYIRYVIVASHDAHVTYNVNRWLRLQTPMSEAVPHLHTASHTFLEHSVINKQIGALQRGSECTQWHQTVDQNTDHCGQAAWPRI